MENKPDNWSWLKNLTNGRVSLPKGISPQFLLFVGGLIFIYITNRLDTERQLRRIDDLNAEIKEMRYEHITTQSQLMNMSKQSEVLRRVEVEGLELRELTEPPRIIDP
ncbi:MAG: hypothetical protein II375_00920 [Bacteroidales bacterium]|nr:hypothetical protein [Bacteroidales bacterium]